MSRIVDDVIHVLRQKKTCSPMTASHLDLSCAIAFAWQEIHDQLSRRDTGNSYVSESLVELVLAEQREAAQADRLREAWREKREILSDIRSVADKHTPLH